MQLVKFYNGEFEEIIKDAHLYKDTIRLKSYLVLN